MYPSLSHAKLRRKLGPDKMCFMARMLKEVQRVLKESCGAFLAKAPGCIEEHVAAARHSILGGMTMCEICVRSFSP